MRYFVKGTSQLKTVLAFLQAYFFWENIFSYIYIQNLSHFRYIDRFVEWSLVVEIFFSRNIWRPFTHLSQEAKVKFIPLHSFDRHFTQLAIDHTLNEQRYPLFDEMRLILFNRWCRSCYCRKTGGAWWCEPPHSSACGAPWKYGMLQIMRRRREKQGAKKIEEVAMNWNNFYATLPISILTPPCREPTTAVSATFGNRPALSSSGGDVGAHQCPRFHLKLFAAQIGEVSWCKTWIRNVQVLEHYGTKRCISSYSFPSLVQSFFHHYFQLWTLFLDSSTMNARRMGVLEVGWLLIFCRSYLQLESRAGWPLFLQRGGGRCIMNDPAASFNFPLFSFLQ